MKARFFLSSLGGVFALALAFAPTSLAIARTNHAVIVGVTEYSELPKSNSLVGPRNDALLARDYLTKQAPVRFDPRHVIILADDVEGAKEPTLALILLTLDELSARVQNGDFVYLHFSGHGLQQPAEDPSTETDGYDEIFLPKDTGRWVDHSKHLPNALIDNKVGEALDKIRAKGAFVWVVFDACHSGTATRAAPAETVVERKIDPDAVGMPPGMLSSALRNKLLTGEVPIEVTSTTSAAKGGIVAFYAAQTNETTPEMPLPKETAEAQIYGLFTYTLFSKLTENPNVTYQQLAEAILQQYASINRTSTTPLFEGDLGTPVFGTMVGSFIPQWPLDVTDRSATIQAGLLHGLVPGSRLAILEKPSSKIEEAIGFFEVKSSANFSSRLALVPAPEQRPRTFPPIKEQTAKAARASRSVRSLRDIPPGSYVRLSEAAYDFTLKVARPAASKEFAHEVAIVNELLDSLAADKEASLHLEIVGPGKDADVRLAVFAEEGAMGSSLGAGSDPALWILSQSGEMSGEEGQRPPSITLQSDRSSIRDAVAQYLTRIYRATNLARISETSDYGVGELALAFTLRRKANGKEVEITTTNMPAGVPGDRVHVRARNNTSTAVDINILYLGSDFSITHIDAERLQPSAVLDKDLLEFTDTSYGRELIVAVFTEARPLTATLDLSFLAQEGLEKADTRGGMHGIQDMILGMGFASIRRGAEPIGKAAEGRPRGAVTLFPVRTVPQQP
ncbi:caspase family protein [Sinorhizobium meliloti]|uniref:Caspase family protein n=1 Tax=Rhizobium meliloti TaxID=382 RepID=A0AAW9TKV8_RHIML|nr:caspase family protein [Sinorhizobium meliloti]MQW33416.1 caspase family protein [Sinorhizobium meliloti]